MGRSRLSSVVAGAVAAVVLGAAVELFAEPVARALSPRFGGVRGAVVLVPHVVHELAVLSAILLFAFVSVAAVSRDRAA